MEDVNHLPSVDLFIIIVSLVVKVSVFCLVAELFASQSMHGI